MSTPGFSHQRKWSIAFHVALAVCSFVAIIAMLNHLGARHYMRLHWSSRHNAELTPRTLGVLNSLTNKIEVTVFFDREKPHSLYQDVRLLLKDYQAASPRITVKDVDYYRDPAEALGIRNRYELPDGLESDLVIFDHDGDYRVVSDKQLASYGYEPGSEEGKLRRRYENFQGELMFTSAIFSVTRDRSLVAYHLQGHGEHDPASSDAQYGYASFAALLRESNIESRVLSLGTEGRIPPDCDLLIVAGPERVLLPEELERIRDYLNQGGRMLALFKYDAVLVPTGLEKLLLDWGVVVNPNLVNDEQEANRKGVFETRRFGAHPIVASLRDTSLFIAFPRTVGELRNRAATETSVVTELVNTSTNATVITEFRDGSPALTGNEFRGEVSLAAAVERGGLPGIAAQRGGVTRIVVMGDSYLFNNQLIGQLGNRDFASNAINWLLDQSELLAGIGPRPMKEYELMLSPAQLSAARYVLLGGFPLAVLFVGFVVWMRRRT